MKKVLKNLKVPSSLLIFLAIFAISIFGLQISKIYAQNSKLSNTLFIKDLAILNDNLTVSGSLGVGKAANSTYSLDVNGPANFNSLAYLERQILDNPNALVRVGYVNDAIDFYIASNVPLDACANKTRTVPCTLPPGQEYLPEACDSGCTFSGLKFLNDGSTCKVVTECSKNLPMPNDPPIEYPGISEWEGCINYLTPVPCSTPPSEYPQHACDADWVPAGTDYFVQGPNCSISTRCCPSDHPGVN